MTQESLRDSHEKTTKLIHLILKSRLNSKVMALILDYVDRNSINWAEFHQIVQQERITPLVYSIIRDQDFVPDFIVRQFKLLYMQNAIRNKVLLKELANVLNAFQENGIPVIVLKGAALLEPVYKNLALRKMSDIDLLIRNEYGSLAFQVLADAGFDSEEERFPGHAIAFEKELHFHKAGIEPINIDLHWHLLNPDYYKNNLPLNWFWQSAVPYPLDNFSALVLCPEALLLHLCGHLWLSIHAIDPNLLWIYDIVALIYTYENELDWDLLLNKAKECQLIYTIGHALNLVANEWDAPVPPDVLAKLQWMDPSPVEVEIFATYISIEDDLSQKVWVKLSDIPSRRQRLLIGLRYLFPSPAYLRFRYGISYTPALPFLYLYRIWLGIISGFQILISYLSKFRQK